MSDMTLDRHWKFYRHWIDLEKQKRLKLMKQSLNAIGDQKELLNAKITLSNQLIAWLKRQREMLRDLE